MQVWLCQRQQKILGEDSNEAINQSLYDEFIEKKQVKPMTQKAINYAEVLYQLKINADELHEAETIVRQNPALQEALTCPIVSKKKRKTEIIDKIFQNEVASFLKVLCSHSDFDQFFDICAEYKVLAKKKSRYSACDALLCDAADRCAKKRHGRFPEKKNIRRAAWN